MKPKTRIDRCQQEHRTSFHIIVGIRAQLCAMRHHDNQACSALINDKWKTKFKNKKNHSLWGITIALIA